MPSDLIKSFAKDTGLSEKRVEEMYAKAKVVVTEQYGFTEKDGSKFYALVTGVLKKMLDIRDSDICVCGECGEEVGIFDNACKGCGSMLMDANSMMLRMTQKDVDALVEFMRIMFKSRTISSGLFTYMRNLVKSYNIQATDGVYDISGRVGDLIK